MIKVNVVAHPNSKKPHIDQDMLGILHIYVREPPLDDRANQAILEALAKFHKVKKSQVRMISGGRSKSKVFEIC